MRDKGKLIRWTARATKAPSDSQPVAIENEKFLVKKYGAKVVDLCASFDESISVMAIKHPTVIAKILMTVIAKNMVMPYTSIKVIGTAHSTVIKTNHSTAIALLKIQVTRDMGIGTHHRIGTGAHHSYGGRSST